MTTEREALDRDHALGILDDYAVTQHPWPYRDEILDRLAECVRPVAGGVLDRDQASDVLRSAYRDDPSEDPEGFEEILDRLAACVRPSEKARNLDE